MKTSFNVKQLASCLTAAGLNQVELDVMQEQKDPDPFYHTLVLRDGGLTIWMNSVFMYYGPNGSGGIVHSAVFQRGDGAYTTLINSWSQATVIKTVIFFLIEKRLNKIMEIPESISMLQEGRS